MITLSKIAKLAHVSVSTVSKAFSMSEDVNPETRELIFDIARQYGCFKKYYRAKYPRHVIAVICPEFKSRHYSYALSQIQEYLTKYNCEICVASTDFSDETTAKLLQYYNQYTSVDGIIFIGSLAQIDASIEIPVVSIGSPDNCSTISITISFMEAMTEIIEYFLSFGVTKIGFVGETLTKSKLNLFKNILTEKGITPDEQIISITNDRFEKGGYSAMEQLFLSGNLPRALICAYDYMAIGAIRCIYDRGLTVPDDIAVLGMDNIPECSYLNPPLTSISSYMGEACKIAADAMLDCLSGNLIKKNISIKAQLYHRKSTELKTGAPKP